MANDWRVIAVWCQCELGAADLAFAPFSKNIPFNFASASFISCYETVINGAIN